MAVLGGKAGGRVRRACAAARWRWEVQGLTPGQIAAKFYRRGYNNGAAKRARAAYNAGHEAGYRQAMDDMGAGRVA